MRPFKYLFFFEFKKRAVSVGTVPAKIINHNNKPVTKFSITAQHMHRICVQTSSIICVLEFQGQGAIITVTEFECPMSAPRCGRPQLTRLPARLRHDSPDTCNQHHTIARCHCRASGNRDCFPLCHTWCCVSSAMYLHRLSLVHTHIYTPMP